MKFVNYYILFSFFSVVFALPNQLPEREYLPFSNTQPNQDRGMVQYLAKSLHGTNQYVLTFDDGPRISTTNQILDELKKYNIKATFFINTIKLNKDTFPTFKRILDEGHIAASHLDKHFNSNKLSKKEFKFLLKKSFNKLIEYHALSGHRMNTAYFRFPYAAYGRNQEYHHMNVIKEVSLELFKENCIHFVFWDNDSSDWIPTLTDNELLQNIKTSHLGGPLIKAGKSIMINGKRHFPKVQKIISEEASPKGGLILFHDIQNKTARNINRILEYFKENNLEVIPLNEVEEFSYLNTSCHFN